MKGLLPICRSGDMDRLEEYLRNRTHHLDALDLSGWGALHYCSYYGQNRLLGRLLSEGCDVNTLTLEGYNCLSIAVERGHCTVIATLLCTTGLTEPMDAHRNKQSALSRAYKADRP